MKRTIFALLAATVLATNAGCGMNWFPVHRSTCDSCGYGNGSCGNGSCGSGSCGNGSCGNGQCGNSACGDGACGNGACGDGACGNGGCGNGILGNGCMCHDDVPRGVGGQYLGSAGPPTGGVAYPYYTNRGPRDFFVNNPPSIGP